MNRSLKLKIGQGFSRNENWHPNTLVEQIHMFSEPAAKQAETKNCDLSIDQATHFSLLSN